MFLCMKTVEIISVTTATGSTKWIVKVNGRPVANYWTKAGAEKRAAQLAA